jgi:hypothetical protein
VKPVASFLNTRVRKPANLGLFYMKVSLNPSFFVLKEKMPWPKQTVEHNTQIFWKYPQFDIPF